MSPSDTDAAAQATRTEVDIDHRSEYFRDHNYEIFDQLHASCPVAHTSAWDGYWLVAGYSAVVDAELDDKTFSSLQAKRIPRVISPDPLVPLDADPPQLEQFRRVLLRRLSPSAAKAEEAIVREMADDFIDQFIEDGRADIVQQLTTPLPALLTLRWFGFDEAELADWVDFAHTMVHDKQSEPQKLKRLIDKIYGIIAQEIESRRVNGLGEDMLSDIMRAEIDGAPITDNLITSYTILMLLGGMDTTSGFVANVLVRLEEQPELRRRLIDDPGILDKATEEFLRHDSPSTGLPRVLTRDCVFHGQDMREGERAVLLFAAANRDPNVFPEPDKIDFERSPNRHVTFGVGKHRCLGSNHARMMFKVMLTAILERLQDWHISGEVERFRDAGEIFAVHHLPVTFTPGARIGS